jgi:hypothetical protein
MITKAITWLMIKLKVFKTNGFYGDGSPFVSTLNYKNPLTYIFLALAFLVYCVYSLIEFVKYHYRVFIKKLKQKKISKT